MPKPIVIDLSHHNVIPHDLNDTRAAGILGVIHKATDGVAFIDAKVDARYSLAKDAGMLWGLYHFLRPGRITQQADWFLSRSQDFRDKDTLLVCDFEVGEITLDEALKFLKTVEVMSGQMPVLYGGNVLKELGAAAKCPKLADYRLWLAQYGPRPVLPKGYKSLWLWQYSESGTVPGIDANVDLNAFNGSEADLKANWVVPVSAAASMPEQNASEEQGGSATAHTSASDQASSSDSSTLSPSTSTIEETKAVSQQTGNTTQAVQTTVTTSAPKGDEPGVPPTQVSKNGTVSNWLFSGGGLASLGTLVWGFVQTNLNAIAVGMVCLTVLILAIIFRKALTDAIRMQTAADPDKKNVT